MHKFIFILSVSLFYFERGYAQNLVPNGSFENYTQCPEYAGQVDKCSFWTDPTQMSSDYFNACDTSLSVGVPTNQGGYQNAKEGVGYCALATYVYSPPQIDWWREYIQVELSEELKTGHKYCGIFYVSLSDLSNYGADEIGMYFSSAPVSCSPLPCILEYNAQVKNQTGNVITEKTNWVEIKGTFIANGNEKYLTIGNLATYNTTNVQYLGSFLSDVAYYYIDAVSLTECRPPVFTTDTLVINQSSSIIIGDTAQDVADYYWTPVSDLSCPTCWQTTANPQQTTTYTLTKITPCDTTEASVTIVVQDPNTIIPLNMEENSYFELHPTASNGSFILNWYSKKTSRLQVHDITGKLIYKQELVTANQQTQELINLTHLTQGIYVVSIEQNNKRAYTKKIVIIE